MSSDQLQIPVSPWPKILLVLLLVLKVAGLVAYGPLLQPDSSDYQVTGTMLLTTTEWMHDAQLDVKPVPQTIFRTLGYPLVVAGLVNSVGDKDIGEHLVILLQIALSVYATIWVFRLAFVFLKSEKLAILAAAGQALSIGFLYDQHILTDSLFNSLFLISFCWPVCRLLEKKPATVRELLLLGLIYTAVAFTRSIGFYFWVLVLPGVVIWIFQDGFKPLALKARNLVLYMLLPATLVAGTMAWNQYRTGYFVYTTGSQFVLIQSIMIMGRRGTDLFTTDQLIDQVAREKITDYSFDNVGAIVYSLFYDHGVNAVESAKLHSAKFFQVFRDYPEKMLYHGLREYEESLVHQFFNVGDNTRTYFKLAAHSSHYKGMKKAWKQFKEDPNFLDGVYVFVLSPMRVFAWFCLVVFILGPPIIIGLRLKRGGALNPDVWRENTSLIYLWGIHFSYTYGLCIVHMVDRFMPAVLAAALIPVLYTFQAVWQWKQNRKGLAHEPA